jgi:hypothetical protein
MWSDAGAGSGASGGKAELMDTRHRESWNVRSNKGLTGIKGGDRIGLVAGRLYHAR